MGALCFVTLFGVVGAKPLPLGEPRVLIRSVKTHTGLLLTKVTKLCIAALDNKANELARQQQQLQQMYQRQLNLNQLLEKSEQDGRAKDKQIADLQTENASLRGQIRSLTAQMDEIKAELWDKINNLRDKLRGAYESLTNVVKAVGMLKYDREKDQNGNYTYGKYGISNLSKAQEKLIDGLAEYGAKWAKEDGFPEMAEEMEKHVGISKGIEKIVEPPAPKRSKGWEMEL